jgi:erythrocyte band 7 integral membrane protein
MVCDLRTVSFDVPPQEILTKDSVTVAVDAVVYYKISSPMSAVCNVTDYAKSTKLVASTTLRTILGTKSLADILSDRESISHDILFHVDRATTPWGIKVNSSASDNYSFLEKYLINNMCFQKVERVEVKDVRLPQSLQRAMAAEAEASREARAKVIAAEGEMKASRSLKEASDVISESPAALQLRYLQTLNSIAAEKNSTIIFPLPIDLMKSFMSK